MPQGKQQTMGKTLRSDTTGLHASRSSVGNLTSSRESRAIPAGGEGSGSEGAQGDHEGDEDRGTRGPLDGTTFGAKFTHLEEESNGDSLEETAGLPPKTSRGSRVARQMHKTRRWYRGRDESTDTYGPPYHVEYGGDLPMECKKMNPSLREVDELLRNGANPSVGHAQDDGLTPLHFAARFGNVEVLEMLKKAGGDPSLASPLGLTPLSYACAFRLSMDPEGGDSREARQVSAIRWLLEHGADPNQVDKAGFSPLAWACRSSIFPAVQALIDAGADVMHRRAKLPGGSQVCLPKVDPLAVITDFRIQKYLEQKIRGVLRKERKLLREKGLEDLRQQRRRAIEEAISRRQEARQFVRREQEKAREAEQLNLELLSLDNVEVARKARREWLSSLGTPQGGVWVKCEAADTDMDGTVRPCKPGTTGLLPPPASGETKRRRPQWIFDKGLVRTKREAHACDVIEQMRSNPVE